MDKLPVYEMIIDENPASDVEVSFIALVDKPAIEKNFMAFSSFKLDFAADPEKKIISGPAMIPDTLIYRRDDTGEYNVFFSKQTIADIALKFFKKDYQKNINLFHDPNLSVQGVTVFESFVSDSARGIQPMKGYDGLPDGTWFISAKVENDAVWNEIKSGAVKGFSVEGYFASVKVQKQSAEERFFQFLSATFEDDSHFNLNSLDMKGKEALKNLIGKFKKEAKEIFDIPATVVSTAPIVTAPAVFQDYQTKDGKTLSIDKMEVGGNCTMGGQPCPPGNYPMADGSEITVGDGGMISAIKPMAMSQPLTMAEVEAAITKALTAYKEELAKATNPYAAKMDAIEAENGKIKTENEKMRATIKGMFEIVEQIAELPTEQPVQSTRQQFVKKFEEDREEKLLNLSQQLAKLKKVS